MALPLPGPHFLTNFLAAAAVAHHLGVAPDAIAEAAADAEGRRSHRGEVLRLGQGVTLLDDCYNSNPAAVEAAVTALGMAARGRRVAFLGDMLELGPTGPELHRETGERLGGRAGRAGGGGRRWPQGFLEGAREAGLAPGRPRRLPGLRRGRRGRGRRPGRARATPCS